MAIARAYHCLCTTLIVATKYELEALPTRALPALDGAIILPLQPREQDVILQNVVSDSKAVIIRREDGFEKRKLLRCNRCSLVLGYQLDQTHFATQDVSAEDIAYILPGALMSTEDMRAENMPIEPGWASQKT